MMKADKDWTEELRRALHDAELTPPSDGWERLRGELAQADVRPKGRLVRWRQMAAAAAAVVLLGVGAGELLWHRSVVPQLTESELADEVLAEQLLPAAASEEFASEEVASVTDAPQIAQALLAASVADLPDGASAAAPRAVPARKMTATASAAEPAEAVSEMQPDADSEPAGLTSDRAAEPAAAYSKAPQPQARQAATRSLLSAAADGDFVAEAQSRGRVSLGVFGGGALNGASNGAGAAVRSFMSDAMSPSDLPLINADGTVAMRRDNYSGGSFRHHQPLGFGLSVRKEFAHGLSLESGVNYTLLRSDVTMKFAADDVSQKLHFIGVPLRMNWQFVERGRLSLYIGAGGMVEKCIAARLGGTAVSENELQWSAAAVLGAQYELGGVVGLYFEPVGSYYFTQTQLRTSRTDSPCSFTLRLGVRMSF